MSQVNPLKPSRKAHSPLDDSGQAELRQRVDIEAAVLARTSALLESQTLLRTTIEHLDQGLVVLDHTHTVRLCNSRSLELLRLPADVLYEGAAFRDIRAFQNARGDFSLMPPPLAPVSGSNTNLFPLIYDWPRPDDRTLEVRRGQLPDGSSVNTFTDVTERRASEEATRESERQQRLLAERVEQLAQIDELTGVLNRRYIMKMLNEEVTRARRGADPFSIALIDLDLFKEINDRFGHPAGDEVLRSFAISVSANVRAIDHFGRYGGEEFLLVLPRSSQEQAATAVDRLREIVAGLNWAALSDELTVTISAGVTQFRPDDGADAMLARADAALYSAKLAGRNRVVSG